MNIIVANVQQPLYPNYPAYTSQINNGNGNNGNNSNSNISSIITNVAKDTIYRNNGWYNKNKVILKYLNDNNIMRCFQCYNSIEYKYIEYSRIIFFNDDNKKKTNKNNSQINHNQTGYISCLCQSCCNVSKISNTTPKLAPKTYGDIIADYILNERFDLIAIDIEKMNQSKMDIIDDKIKYLKFNLNEKNVILNNLVNENDKLSNNLDLEVEKFKILNEQYCKNKELCDNIKTQLLQFSVDLFKQNKKQIDEQINKYSELNSCSKYSIPECKICMTKEIKVAIQCGHVFCMECYNELVKTQQIHKTLHNNSNINVDADEDSAVVIHCPTCRTESCTYTQLYF